MSADGSNPINAAYYTHAAREVRRALDAAERGDAKAMGDVIEMQAAPALRVALARLAVVADKCAPSSDELRINRGCFTGDQAQLRFASDAAVDALSAAAGRVVALETQATPATVTPGRPLREVFEGEERSDSGELPMPSPAIPFLRSA